VLARARALAGGGLAAIYLTDIEGACLLRLAGDAGLPSRLDAVGAVGPEFDDDGLRGLRSRLLEQWPEATVAPLVVLGRALGVLVTSTPAGDGLTELAGSVAPTFELASGFTDVFERSRRRKQPSAAAEVQLELLPPRLVRVAGGGIAASVLPAYDVGGDWFDHAENPEGVWIAIGDAMGKGIRAAAISAISIGAFRSARRAGADPRDCARAIHRAIDELETNAFVTAVIGCWDQHRAEFSWTNCGHLRPLLVRDGWVRELVADTTYPLGILGRERTFPSSTVPVRPGDRVFIYSDGIVEAPMGDGERFGLGRLKRLLVQTAGQPPAATAAALERSVLEATGGEIADDATQLLLAIGYAT